MTGNRLGRRERINPSTGFERGPGLAIAEVVSYHSADIAVSRSMARPWTSAFSRRTVIVNCLFPATATIRTGTTGIQMFCKVSANGTISGRVLVRIAY
jgi:hypothetical protein